MAYTISGLFLRKEDRAMVTKPIPEAKEDYCCVYVGSGLSRYPIYFESYDHVRDFANQLLDIADKEE